MTEDIAILKGNSQTKLAITNVTTRVKNPAIYPLTFNKSKVNIIKIGINATIEE